MSIESDGTNDTGVFGMYDLYWVDLKLFGATSATHLSGYMSILVTQNYESCESYMMVRALWASHLFY